MCVDIDHLDSELPVVRKKLRASPHLKFDCESVTGTGLHAIFPIAIGTKPDAEVYLRCFKAVEQHVQEVAGVQIDPACKDPARLSFVSADRNARLNRKATPIAPLPETSEPKTETKPPPRPGKPSKEQVRDLLQFVPQRPDYPDWLKIVSAVGDALSDADAIEVLNEWSPEEERGEYAKKLKNRLRDVHIGTLYTAAREHGWIPRYEIKGQNPINYARKEIDKSQNLLGNHWLERGHGASVTGPSGIGKSTATYQMAAEWACGRVSFGISVPHALRTLVIQTEDSENDLIRMCRCIDRLKLTELERAQVELNMHIETINDCGGKKFIEKLDSLLQQKSTDLVILNPLSDFIESELVNEAEVKKFLRTMLNPLLAKHKCGVLCIQPTPKISREDIEKRSYYGWQYWSAGSAEFARWARGAVVIVPNEQARDVFRFIAAKRFDKIGWTSPTYWFAHSAEHDIALWIPATEEQISTCKKVGERNPEDLWAIIPAEKELLRQEIHHLGRTKLKMGYHLVDDFLAILESHDWIRTKIQKQRKKKGRPQIRFLKNEHPSEPLL
jgi:hypothetical protein